MSIGDLVMNAMGGGSPGQQINQALQGPQPGGGMQQPGSTQIPQQGGMAGPQATQSPPDLASLYIKLMQQSRNANDFDRNMALFAGGFKGPPGGADRLLNAVQPAQDPGVMLQNLMQIRQMQAMQNMPVPTVGGDASGGGQPAAMSGGGVAAAGGQPAAAGGGQPIMSPQQWAAMTPTQKQEMVSRMAESRIQTSEALTKESGQNKLDAVETYPTLDPQYKTAEDTVTWLSKHPEATATAIKMGPQLAGGVVGETLGSVGLVSSDVRDARAKLDQLNNENFRAGLANVKNVRSQTEAIRVGGAVSSLDNRANSKEAIQQELTRLNSAILGARGNLMAAAGKEIPYRYKDLVDSSYLTPGSQVYNGAKLEQPDTSVKSPSDVSKLPSGRAFVIPDGSGQIGYAP